MQCVYPDCYRAITNYNLNRFVWLDSGLLQPDGAWPEPVDLEEEEDFEEFGGNLENEDRQSDED